MKNYSMTKKLMVYWIIITAVILSIPIIQWYQLDNTLVFVLLSLVACASLVLMMNKQTTACRDTTNRINNLENRINSSNEITDACLKKIQEKAVGKTKREVADFLHDMTLGNLSSINLLLSKHLHEHSGEMVSKDVLINSQNLILKTYGELREKVDQLKDENCSDLAIDFVLEIETLVQTILEPLGIQSYFNFDQISKFESLCFDTQLEVYQLMRECINNVIKHSKADKLLVEIKGGDHELEFSFIDNGIGFDSQKKQQGGLVSLKRRIENKLGRFQIHNGANGLGTEVKFALPI